MKKYLLLKKVKNTIPWTYLINDLNGEEIIGTFYEKELQKTNQEEFRIEKVIRQKGDKLYVKWKGYDNSFNSWIDKANLVQRTQKDIIKMSYYPPYRSSSNNIKVELYLANYATKDDVKYITHVDVSNFASKTNLAALKTEVDQIDTDKLKTPPTDLAKLTNAIENDVVKKTDYNAKVTSIEAQITGLTKNTTDNLNDITKLKAVDTNNFVLKTKFSADINALDDQIDCVEKKIPDISGLATKTSLNSYLQTSTFNSNVTEVESKIKDADIIAKSANTKANTIRRNLTAYAEKDEVATDITTIKNDYVTNANLSSQLNDLKSQHIATEVTGIDNKTKKMLVIF